MSDGEVVLYNVFAVSSPDSFLRHPHRFQCTNKASTSCFKMTIMYDVFVVFRGADCFIGELTWGLWVSG